MQHDLHFKFNRIAAASHYPLIHTAAAESLNRDNCC